MPLTSFPPAVVSPKRSPAQVQATELLLYWITLIPAVFMTMVCSTYILIAPEGFQLENNVAYMGGAVLTILISLLFWYYAVQRTKVFAQLM